MLWCHVILVMQHSVMVEMLVLRYQLFIDAPSKKGLWHWLEYSNYV